MGITSRLSYYMLPINPISPKPKQSNQKKHARPAEHSFKIPPGRYSAELKEAFVIERGYGSKMRFVFELECNVSPGHKLLAGKSYRVYACKMMFRDLRSWLGADLKKIMLTPTGTSTDELETLVGTKADLEVTHRYNRHYEQPLCYINKISPPGKLTGVGLN